MYARDHHKSAPKNFKMRTYDKLIRCELRGIYSGKMGKDGNWSQDRFTRCKLLESGHAVNAEVSC